MAKTHKQEGDVIEVTLSATFASGELIKVGDLAGVCLGDGVSGDKISVAVREVFEVDKLSTDDIAQGAEVFLDETNKRVTLDATGNISAGKAFTAAGNGDTVVEVSLNA